MKDGNMDYSSNALGIRKTKPSLHVKSFTPFWLCLLICKQNKSLSDTLSSGPEKEPSES